MHRNNFMASDIKSRNVIDFARLQADEDKFKVEIGEKTMKKLFTTQVDDPTDIAWLAEKARLMSEDGYSEEELQHRLPLGRPQRKTTKTVSLADTLSNTDKISQLNTWIASNNTATKEGKAVVIGKLIEILDNPTEDDISKIELALRKLNIPLRWEEINNGQYEFTYPDYKEHSGAIHLYLLTNARDIKRPIRVVNKDGDERMFPLTSLQKLLAQRNGRYDTVLDVATQVVRSANRLDASSSSASYHSRSRIPIHKSRLGESSHTTGSPVKDVRIIGQARARSESLK